MLDITYKYRENQLKDFPYGDMPLEMCCLYKGQGYYINEITGCYRTDSGGYNSTMRKNPQLQINNLQRVISAYQSFDKMTKHKYHDDIHIGCLRYQYRIDQLQEDNPERILDIKYIDLFKSLPILQRCRIKIKYNLPAAYMVLKKMKSCAKKCIFNNG